MLILLFLGSLVCSFALILFFSESSSSERLLSKRLQIIAVSRKQEMAGEGAGLLEKPPEGIFYALGEYVRRFHFAEHLENLILHAGSKITVGAVVGSSVATAVCVGFLSHVTVGVLGVDIAVALVGLSGRWISLRWKKARRLKQFNAALPDAIELIARALRAGHSINSALEIVAEQSIPPLNAEFAIVYQQQKFGLQFRDALLKLGDRVPSKDLHFLITAILVQKETGGDLTGILDRTTHVIRERIRIEGEIRTYTAQGRLTGWILGALPVIMLAFINLITPGYSHLLFYDPVGQKLLGAGGVLLVVGGLIIRKVVKIEV